LDGASWTDEIGSTVLPRMAAQRFSARLPGQPPTGWQGRRSAKFQRLLGDRNTPQSIAERARVMMAMLTEGKLTGAPTPGASPTAAAEVAASGDDKGKAKAAGKKAK
jgi:hypothetical protein